MMLTMTLQKAVKERLKAPKTTIFSLARELNIPEQAIIQCLPEKEVVKVGPDKFDEIMKDIATWGKITFIVQNDFVVLEARGPIPTGSYSHGYFNMIDSNSIIGGHIRSDHIGAIFFVNRPVMGLPSMSIQFFNLSGDPMFKIYLSRDEKKQFLSKQVEKFEALKKLILAGESVK